MTCQKLILTLALGATLAGLARASDADDNQRYDTARDQYEIGHYADAFSTFAALADKGHCDAVRMATQMARLGRAHYGTDFKAEPERVARWMQHSRCASPQRQLAAKP